MANIEPYVYGITKAAIDGHEVRKIVVDCLEAINQNGPDAETFKGLTSDKYAKSGTGAGSMQYKMTLIYNKIRKDDKPSETSERLLMTKGIRSIIGPLSKYP